MASLAPWMKASFDDANGNPLAGGKLYTYLAGTTTPQGTFTDETGNTPNTNPIILDSAGRADIWLGSGTYKFVLADSNDVVQWTVDNVTSGASSDSTSAWTTYNVTDGQAATALSGQTVDFATYSSALYEFEIKRGTTVIANGEFKIQNLNGTGRLITGPFYSAELHGVTFSISQAALIAQLKAALDSGAGNGTIKIARRLVPA